MSCSSPAFGHPDLDNLTEVIGLSNKYSFQVAHTTNCNTNMTIPHRLYELQRLLGRPANALFRANCHVFMVLGVARVAVWVVSAKCLIVLPAEADTALQGPT